MFSSKKKRKTGPVWHRSAVEATLDAMPRYNGHACGTGAHGDTKYNRTKQKRAWRNELRHVDPLRRVSSCLLRVTPHTPR